MLASAPESIGELMLAPVSPALHAHSPLATTPAASGTATPDDGLGIVFRPGFLSSSPSSPASLASPSLAYLDVESSRSTPSTAKPRASTKRPRPLVLDQSAVVNAEAGASSSQGGAVKGSGSAGSSSSVHSNEDIMSELQHLNLLGSSVRRNLEARPIDVSSDSELGSPDLDCITLTELATIHPSNLLIIDNRSLEAFLERHLPCSAHLSIPSLIYKRLTSPKAKWTGNWEALGRFVSTEASRRVWDKRRQEVVVVGDDADVMVDLMRSRNGGRVRVLAGGWQGVEATPGVQLCSGEDSTPIPSSPRTAPMRGPLHHPSMPSLRFPEAKDDARRQLPKLDTRRGPKLSLNLSREPVTAPLRSASMGGAFDGTKRKTGLTLDLTHSRHLAAGPSTAALPLRSPHPLSTKPSLQSICRAQAKLPPSPSSFGEVNQGFDVSPPATPLSPRRTARPPPMTPVPGTRWSGTEENAGDVTSGRNGGTPFVVSTILPSFLYLGPEITSEEDIQQLKDLGIKRILNSAIECDDDEALGLRARFDRYLRLPIRDNVEEKNIGKGVRDACDFIDDARLHDAPVYVHCKAGRSRSVTVVLAYLIHANAWTLKTAYAYVAERRAGISPNIGFVAELMLFEEAELGHKKALGIGNEHAVKHEDDKRNKYARESLPPAWSNSLDGIGRRLGISEMTAEPDSNHEQSLGEHETEREVRKNGHYVHSRRAPVNESTLQPMRRFSKAGLESLRGLTATSPSPSTPCAGKPYESVTPSPGGRAGWL